MSDKTPVVTEKHRTAAAAMMEVIRKTDKERPTADDRAELDRILRDVPAVWTVAGDVMNHTALGMINQMKGTYALTASLRTGWEQLQRDLARPSDGPLEALLIQQIALAWLKLAYTEHHHRHFLMAGNVPITQCDFWERRLTAAQRRFLRATETLMRVRRLQLPAVQVNIAEQQVNQVNARG
jgi:hypothetical protein